LGNIANMAIIVTPPKTKPRTTDAARIGSKLRSSSESGGSEVTSSALRATRAAWARDGEQCVCHAFTSKMAAHILIKRRATYRALRRRLRNLESTVKETSRSTVDEAPHVSAGLHGNPDHQAFPYLSGPRSCPPS